jgi:hypothetical protein
VTSGDRIFRTVKIERLPDGSLFGGAGGLADILKVKAWLAHSYKGEAPEISDKASFECLHVRSDGSTWLIDEDLVPMRFTDSFLALGTGSQFAQAAMYLGKSPQEAVAVAAQFDPSTSLPIDELTLVRKVVKKRKTKHGR